VQLFDRERAGHDRMKVDKSRQYQYVKIDDYYFCLQQNPAVLAWLLFLKRDELITIQPWLKKKNIPLWKMICSRYYWNIFKRNLITLLIFVQCRFNLRKLDTVHLPVYGQFGISVHKGYKIFNLRSGVVTKIFDPDVDKSSVVSEIEQLKKVSHIDFAPSLRRWDIDERWYQEDYIRGNIATSHRSFDSYTFLNAFYGEAVPCMNSLISYQRFLTKDLQAYLQELNGILDISRFTGRQSYSREAEVFGNFVKFTVERLKNSETQSVLLAFTHGDFCPANILSTKDGIRIVDWETAGYRSLLFDFYSYFFYRPVNIKNISVEKMSSELDQALPAFISGVDVKALDVSAYLSTSLNTYRRLYYMEYLCKLMERLLTDKSLNIMDYIMRYIDVFSLYEEECNKEAKNGQRQSMIFHNALMNSL